MPFRKPQAGFMFPEAFSTVLTNARVTREALRVLGVLLKHIGWNNRSVVTVKEIGVHLGIAPQHVSRGMALLRAQQIVLPSTRRGEFELHPALVHVGTLASARKKQKWRVAQDAKKQAVPS
jgi:DNA-binding IclR family transcriptional regulator